MQVVTEASASVLPMRMTSGCVGEAMMYSIVPQYVSSRRLLPTPQSPEKTKFDTIAPMRTKAM